jgi:hypothetical protein
MRMKYRVLTSMLVGLCGLGLGSAIAQADSPSWAGKPDHSDNHRVGDRYHADDPRRGPREYRGHDHYRISTREQFFIQDWYRRHRHAHRAHKLPPGHVRKLYRGAPWPPPYTYAPLPREVVRGLQPLPPGFRYYQVGTDVVIANMTGHVVTDVVYGLLNR